ncbi:MAG: DUF4838 domain-containing protein [Chitinophagales bacterium]|nr:DUF4838 domain-containing protein [Chitinophagales bacterium]MCZ2394661.1 DUF4838 domain-containing protein [Chitinophagales bacterium]
MKYNKLFISVLVVLFLTSCVLIKEQRNHKKHQNIEYEAVYNDETEKLDFESASRTSDSNEIWYHPNPWWRIKSEPFTTSNPSVQNIRFRPQYGFSFYIDPNTHLSVKDVWDSWIHKNAFSTLPNPAAHNWQAFISTYKDLFSAHPEYLAEKDGKRLGYGKTSKLCVSNPDVQKLYIQYTKDRILKNPEIDMFSVEPSDGAGHCTCNNCTKIGSVSNQVFYLANIIAKGIKNIFPNKTLGLYAYYFHADVPSFPLEDNILVLVAPQGFQDFYSAPLGLLNAWYDRHKNIGVRGYLAIPQWKAEQPRVYKDYFFNEVLFAANINSKFVEYETGTSLNTILFSTLLSKISKNPSLTWEEVFDKFLNDCFPSSKIPMERLFNRWFNEAWIKGGDEILYSLYDINEASKLTKNRHELQRIRDLKAYVNYLIIYEDFSLNKNNKAAVIKLFDYLYNSSNRNIVNVYALTRLLEKYYNNYDGLKEKYIYKKIEDKKWIQYLSDNDIDKLFEENIRKFTPIKSNYLTIDDINDIFNQYHENIQYIKDFSMSLRYRDNLYFYNLSNTIKIKPTYSAKDSKTIISIESVGSSNIFFSQKFLDNNEEWEVNIPKNTIYKISQKRVSSCDVSLKGEVIPMTSIIPKNVANKYNVNKFDKNKKLIKTESTIPILDAFPIYILTPKINSN